MKKIIVAIFAVFYLGLSAGATVHLHYCMGKLVEWKLWHSKKDDKCSRCGMKKSQSKKGCCKDENKFVKIADDQKATGSFYLTFQASFIAVTPLTSEQELVYSSGINEKKPVSHAPPLVNDTGIYLLNCIFRI